MPARAIFTGICLFLLGVGSYFMTGQQSPTALIPSAFGTVFILLGVIARKQSIRKHVMHVAVLVAALGIAGTAGGVIAIIKKFSGTVIENEVAAWAKLGMCVLCLLFLIDAIRSFISARGARKAES